MSRYAKYILISLVLLAPKLSHAATVSFGEKQWELNPTISSSEQSSAVRGFDLKNLSQHILLGKSLQTNFATLDPAAIAQIEKIQTETNQKIVNAQMVVDGSLATTFVPHQDGQSVDVYSLLQSLNNNLSSVALPVVSSRPQTVLSDLNNLGITELIARGESDFSGSTSNRIVNITVGSSKYNGVIIPPGEEFSFNKILGDVDAEHGFKPEMVIKRTGVTPEFGGGLCQVSSTMFRAAMNAGLPITARRNHSFAVHYYFPQGTDATIYPGVQDLKYINNMKNHIVILTHMDLPNRKLYFDIYGTKDGREVAFDGPVQYDKQANGALKATWTRHVTISGQTTTQVFNSTYQPPALFQPSQTVAASTPNPDSPAPTPTPTSVIPPT